MTRQETRNEPVAPTGATFTLAFSRMAYRAVARIVIRTWAALKNRRQVTLLNQLDDRALKDIGLMRSDVDAALCIPLHLDPSLHLAEISGHSPVGGNIRQHPAQVVRTEPLHRLRRSDEAVEPGSLKALRA